MPDVYIRVLLDHFRRPTSTAFQTNSSKTIQITQPLSYPTQTYFLPSGLPQAQTAKVNMQIKSILAFITLAVAATAAPSALEKRQQTCPRSGADATQRCGNNLRVQCCNSVTQQRLFNIIPISVGLNCVDLSGEYFEYSMAELKTYEFQSSTWSTSPNSASRPLPAARPELR